MRPEDVPDQTKDTDTHFDTEKLNHQQQPPHRSVSDGAVTRRNSNAYFVNRNFKSAAAASILATQSFAEQSNLRRPNSQQMTDGRMLSSRNPYGSSFHAISTGTDMAMESPLSRKIGAPFAATVPPRHISNRISFPLSAQAMSVTSSTPLSPELRSVEPQDTPVLDNRHELEYVARDSSQVVVSLSPTHSPVAALPSSSNVSDWSLGAESIARAEVELRLGDGTRIKYLNWLSPATGPVLTIYPDAEALLRGPTDQISEIPPSVVPNSSPSTLPSERSFSALEDDFSREVKLRESSGSVAESPVRSSVDVSPITITPVRINPIRSMQPTRKSNMGDITPSLSPGNQSPLIALV